MKKTYVDCSKLTEKQINQVLKLYYENGIEWVDGDTNSLIKEIIEDSEGLLKHISDIKYLVCGSKLFYSTSFKFEEICEEFGYNVSDFKEIKLIKIQDKLK